MDIVATTLAAGVVGGTRRTLLGFATAGGVSWRMRGADHPSESPAPQIMRVVDRVKRLRARLVISD